MMKTKRNIRHSLFHLNAFRKRIAKRPYIHLKPLSPQLILNMGSMPIILHNAIHIALIKRRNNQYIIFIKTSSHIIPSQCVQKKTEQ